MFAALLFGGTTANKAAGQGTLVFSPTATSGVAANTLTTAPTSEPFGSVPVGMTKSQTVELRNSGPASVTISSATLSGKGFTLHGITTPLMLAGGKTVSITLSYAPAAPGYVAGSISIVSNAANKTLTMAVSGTGVTAPRITASPANRTVTAGQTATFTVVAAGTAPLSYQWQKNGVNIAGATAASYTTPATTASDNGSTFTVVVSNTVRTVASAAATLTVNAVAPRITTSPTNHTVTAGQTATFTVVAAGTAPLSYQWQKNGVSISGATAASYTTPATTTSGSGSRFAVVVKNTGGTVTSAAATLTVNAVAPRITTSPTNHTVTAGQTATFTVVAAGTAPLSYQWQKNGVSISGATAASYTTPATTTSGSGSRFAVVVKNTGGTVTSAAATLTVNAVAPRITTSPANRTVTVGQTAIFTVVAAGTAPLSYQWQKNGVNISGATAASYTTPATTTSASGSRFAVVVKNTRGTVTSAAATLTVSAAPVGPTIITSPANRTVTVGQTAIFTVVAAGTAPLSYQWQKNGVNISGATAASYTTPATTTSASGSRFAVVVKNTRGTVTSAAATLTVSAAPVGPTIITSPANRTVTAGQTAIFTVVAAGTAPLSYQWQKNGVNIVGATAASYTTPATTTSASGSRFAVVVKNTRGTVTSAAATLTVSAAPVGPTIITSPANRTVTAGQTAIFTVVAAGTAPLSYQWQKNGVNISGATAASYTTPATTTSASGSRFAVVVKNTRGTVTSAAATLTVSAAPVGPTIITSPANRTVTVGQTAIFTVVAAGTAPLSYQWQKNGVNISGATAASYTTPATTTSASGSRFAVVVKNTVGTVTSAAATLTVSAAPVTGIHVSSSSINFGNEAVGNNLSQALIITNTGTATLTITQVTETGSAFSVSGFSVPLNVSVGQKTTITVAFRPTTVGAASGNISIVSNAPGSPTSVGLSGTGIAATLTLGISPTSLSFGNVTTGASSASKTVTITNTGNANVTISQITLSGSGYSMTGGSAPVTPSPSQNLTLSVQFSPKAAGSVTGTISIVSNASGSPARVALSGTGVASVQHSVVLSWNASSSSGITGYYVYRAIGTGGYTKLVTSPISGLNYTDTTVATGTAYTYVLTAVDSEGMESAYSDSASVTVP